MLAQAIPARGATLPRGGLRKPYCFAEMKGYKAARDAGVNIASFSGNTAYWKIRYEDGGRTLVCYKAVEGTKEGSVPDGSKGVNDWGPDGVKGTKDDALGLDGKAGTADDNPKYATTTWRDDGAPPGNPNAPTGGRVGPNEPENSLLGSMYVGDNDNFDYPLTIPATNGADEFAGDRIWRNTGISEGESTTINSKLNGWEWDSIPTQAQYLSKQPSGVKRVSSTDVGSAPSPAEWIQDEGLLYSTTPPPGQPTDRLRGQVHSRQWRPRLRGRHDPVVLGPCAALPRQAERKLRRPGGRPRATREFSRRPTTSSPTAESNR